MPFLFAFSPGFNRTTGFAFSSLTMGTPFPSTQPTKMDAVSFGEGFGKAHMVAGNQDWGGKMQKDLYEASNLAVSERHADPERIAIFGHSYGGYAVLSALTSMPGKYTCGVDIMGAITFTYTSCLNAARVESAISTCLP
jgi:dienelactone hydrolase